MLGRNTWRARDRHTMATVAGKRGSSDEDENTGFGIRKKLKLSDLPLSSSKRADVEALVQKMKKKGYFDVLRKQGYSKFDSGVSAHRLFSLRALTPQLIGNENNASQFA